MNLASRTYEEKRNFIRMKVETPVEISVNHRQLHGICHNLSGGGMAISADEPLSLGVEVEVTVSSHYSHSPVLHALTKVCRIQPGERQYRMALEIVSLLD